LLILGIGKVLQVFIALVSIKVLTTFLSEKEVGNYYLLQAIILLFSFVFLNPLGQYYGRQLIHWDQKKNLLNATSVLLFLRISAIVLSLCIAMVLYELLEYNKYYSLEVFLLFLFVSLIAGAHGVLLNAVNILGDRVKFTIYMLSTLCIGFILSLVIVLFIDNSGMSWLYGVAISQLIVSFPLYRTIVRNNNFSLNRIKTVFQKKYIKKITIFMMPVTITLFLQWGQNTSYRFIIEAKYSLEVLAFIGVGLTLSAAVFRSAESLATQFYYPIFLRQITYASKEDRAIAWNGLFGYMLPIYVILTVYVILFSPYLAKLLVAEKFYEAYIYAMFGAMIEFLRVITNLVYIVSQSEVKTNTTIIPYLFGFMVTVLTLYFIDMSNYLWMIPLFLVISNGIIFIMLFRNMKKLLDIKIDMINLIKTLLYSLPLFLVLFIVDDKSMGQTLVVLGISGAYFIIMLFLILHKKKLGDLK
jgi:O-antigen/teichoic acid export membrane protein